MIDYDLHELTRYISHIDKVIMTYNYLIYQLCPLLRVVLFKDKKHRDSDKLEPFMSDKLL